MAKYVPPRRRLPLPNSTPVKANRPPCNKDPCPTAKYVPPRYRLPPPNPTPLKTNRSLCNKDPCPTAKYVPPHARLSTPPTMPVKANYIIPQRRPLELKPTGNANQLLGYEENELFAGPSPSSLPIPTNLLDKVAPSPSLVPLPSSKLLKRRQSSVPLPSPRLLKRRQTTETVVKGTSPPEAPPTFPCFVSIVVIGINSPCYILVLVLFMKLGT